MIAQRTIRGIELLNASVLIVIPIKICYIDAAVIGCMDAAFGIGIIHKAIFAAAFCNLIDLELIQIVSRLGVFRGNIAAGSKVVLCILLDMTAIVPDISMGYVNVLYRSEPFGSVRICLNHALPVTHLK